MSYTPQWRERRDDILKIAEMVKQANPEAWHALAEHGTPDRRYINLVSASLIAAGIPAGVNQKRGNQGDSIDVIALPNVSGVKDSSGTYAGLELYDIVADAEGAHKGLVPRLTFTDVTQATFDNGVIGGWKAGSGVPKPTPQPVPVPPPPPPPVVPGREEALEELQWLDSYYSASSGLQRVNGLSINGRPDFEGIAAWYLDVYQRARLAGKTRTDARAAVIAAIQATDEWQRKHPKG